MSKTLFISHIFGGEKYYEYVPYFIYGVEKTQPDGFVKIICESSVPDKIKLALKYCNNFEIVEGFKFHLYSKKITQGQLLKSYRWLWNSEYFTSYDYAYIGDIDFIYYDYITESHEKNATKLGLPFSNGIRPWGKALTGLHFIKVKEYFEKMDFVIDDALKNPDKYISRIKDNHPRNEHFLYEIVKEGIGFNGHEVDMTDGNAMYYRPHPGLHLGMLRTKDMQKRKMPEYILDDKFLHIHRIVENFEIEKVIKFKKNEIH